LQLRTINLVGEEPTKLLEPHHVKILQHECRLFHGQFVRDSLGGKPILLENHTNLASLLPDENVICDTEGGLDVCNQESVLFGSLILHKHHGEVFGVTLVLLLEDGVLGLPDLGICVLGQVPPVIEACQLLRGDLILNHDLVSETLELVF